MDYIYFNNTLYRASGKSFYKFDMEHQQKALLIEKKERKSILEFIESRSNLESKSQKINQIFKVNPKLKNIEGIETILEAVESTIPNNLRKQFYNNLKTVKIYFLEYYSEKERSQQGTYNGDTNSIVIYTPEHIKNASQLKNWEGEPQELYDQIIKHTLIHELFHMSSSSYDNKKNVLISGFEYQQLNEDRGLILFDNFKKGYCNNSFIDEGFTDVLTNITATNLDLDLGFSYIEESSIVMQLINLGCKDAFEKGYFKQMGTSLIQKQLCTIINDPARAEYLISLLNNIGLKKEGPRNYYMVIKAESMILDYYDKLLDITLAIGSYESAKQICKSLGDFYVMIFKNKDYELASVCNPGFTKVEQEIENKLESVFNKLIKNIQRTRK